MNDIEQREDTAVELHAALAKTIRLRWPSQARDMLWLVVQSAICTRGHTYGTAMGSTAEQDISGEDARQDELLAAMLWLTAHDDIARQMSPDQLARLLRGVAVRGSHGSARTAQADALHGMTEVAPGALIEFVDEPVAS